MGKQGGGGTIAPGALRRGPPFCPAETVNFSCRARKKGETRSARFKGACRAHSSNKSNTCVHVKKEGAVGGSLIIQTLGGGERKGRDFLASSTKTHGRVECHTQQSKGKEQNDQRRVL